MNHPYHVHRLTGREDLVHEGDVQSCSDYANAVPHLIALARQGTWLARLVRDMLNAETVIIRDELRLDVGRALTKMEELERG